MQHDIATDLELVCVIIRKLVDAMPKCSTESCYNTALLADYGPDGVSLYTCDMCKDTVQVYWDAVRETASKEAGSDIGPIVTLTDIPGAEHFRELFEYMKTWASTGPEQERTDGSS